MTESAEQNALAAMTAEIVSAYVSHNQIATAELADLIGAVAGQLGRIGSEPEQPAEKKLEPAVPVRRSIQPDHLICLVCGKKQKTLRRHLAVAHGLAPGEYRNGFDLKPDYPMAAPNYSAARSELARKIGLGRPKKAGRKGRKSTAEPSRADVGH